MKTIIDYLEKIYAFWLLDKTDNLIAYKEENLLISHTVCPKGVKFKYKCDKCESLSGQCINSINDKNN
jgi:hypothetical protein